MLSLGAASSGDYSRAEQLGRDSLVTPSNPFGQFLALWALSLAFCGMEQYESARSHLSQALHVAASFHGLGMVTWLLPLAALLEYRAGREIRALELLSMAMNHPLSTMGWIERWT